MAEKRKRSQNFSMEEKDKLVKLMVLRKDTLLNKKTDGTTNDAKNKAWIEVTTAFNSSGTIYRTKDSLMKLWEKLKTESKSYYQASKRSTTATGGGPSDVKIDPVLEQVCALIGRACTGIIGVQDCDSDLVAETPITQPKKIKMLPECYVDENSDQIENDPSNLIVYQVMEDTQDEPTESPKPHFVSENNIIRTPLWSRRRPQLSQTNERTEIVSNMCSSFQNVNKKKEEIEDLKRRLLEEEIEFKRKMYDLQLKTAVAELEIKSEILNQVRGGAINLQSWFGVPRSTE